MEIPAGFAVLEDLLMVIGREEEGMGMALGTIERALLLLIIEPTATSAFDVGLHRFFGSARSMPFILAISSIWQIMALSVKRARS